jgi:hypothetical protein
MNPAFGVTDRPAEVSETRYCECNYLYTKDRAECKYPAAGSTYLLAYLNFDTKWFHTTALKVSFNE